jgi:hypothetical protein
MATVLGLACLAPAAAATSVAPAESNASPRGELRPACRPPTPPVGARLISISNTGGVRVWSYTVASKSPLQVVLYYLQAVPRQGYGIQGWGAGGNSQGTGGGLNAYSRACGYLGVSSSAAQGQPANLQVCTGATAAVLKRCANGRNRSS